MIYEKVICKRKKRRSRHGKKIDLEVLRGNSGRKRNRKRIIKGKEEHTMSYSSITNRRRRSMFVPVNQY